MSTTSRQLLIRMAVIVIVWYLASAFLPQLAGTCFDGECGFSLGEIVVSFVILLAVIAVPVLLETRLYKKNLSQALSDIGLTRFSWVGIRSAAIYLLPLLFFFPLFALLTNTPLALTPNWEWRLMNVLFVNGLAEEVMMRGFVFRHLREGRSFWHAAALSTAYFAAYHLVLIITAGPLIGIIAVVIAIPAGFLTAYVYERGSNTIWGSALFHMLYNGPAFVFAASTDVQPAASSLYLVTGILISTFLVVRAYRGGYERGQAQTNVDRHQFPDSREPLAQ